MKHLPSLILALSLTVLPQPGHAFRSLHGMTVNSIKGSGFEVTGKGFSRSDDYWCAASEYARRVQKAGWTTRIYVTRGRGPSVISNRHDAVQFSIEPGVQNNTGGGRSLNALAIGKSKTISQANRYCSSMAVAIH